MKPLNTLFLVVLSLLTSTQAHAFGALPFKFPVPGQAPAPAPPPSPKACSFNGKSIASGSSVIAYQNANVNSGQACVSQLRACSNGTLSGTFLNSSCVITPASPPPASVPTAPQINKQPLSQTVNVGQAATFTVVVTGSDPLSYQWKKNGMNISGATSASYVTPAAQNSDNGAAFSVQVSNSAGSVVSAGASLTVISTGKTYFVSTAGSDSNPGSQAFPFLTIAHAYSQVVAGDTILVAPGTYTEYGSYAGIDFRKNGTANAPITIKSTVLHGAVIDAGGSPLSARNYGAYVFGNYNVIDGFKFANSGYTALRVDGANNTIWTAGGGLDTFGQRIRIG
jgi:Immunoglobulin domain/Protein of unknown function (DUF1565)